MQNTLLKPPSSRQWICREEILRAPEENDSLNNHGITRHYGPDHAYAALYSFRYPMSSDLSVQAAITGVCWGCTPPDYETLDSGGYPISVVVLCKSWLKGASENLPAGKMDCNCMVNEFHGSRPSLQYSLQCQIWVLVSLVVRS